MKKSLLLILALSIGIIGFSQKAVLKPGLKSVKAISGQRIGIEPLQNAPSVVAAKPAALKSGDETDAVTIVTLGSSANAYGWGYAGGQKTLVWADNNLNTVSLFHRMGGPQDPGGYSGDLGYDISKDGGNTWTKMIECWTAVENSGGTYYLDAGRYPNHGIYNPAGNTNPDNAFVSFFGATISGTNGADSWGGYAIGTSRIGDPTDTTREWRSISPTPGIYQYIPDGYCVTQNGEAWVTDMNQDWTSGTIVYQGNAIVNHGIWNNDENRFEYTEYLMDFPTSDNSRPANNRVAFGPDGLIGYVCVLADNGEVPFAAGTSYFPILYKTTDGGMSWEGPISVTLGGPDGIWEVLNYLTDAQIGELFLPPLPARDEIPYTTAFDFDIAVDAWGNPHIAVVVGATGSDAYSIVSAYPFTCVFDITSLDGGQTWTGHQLGRPKTFRGTFGADYTEDNRVNIASTMDGSKIFVTWLDTDLPGVEDNNQPDVFCRGIDVATNKLTAIDSSGVILDRANNVTAFSEAMWQSYFQVTSTYVFEDNGVWTIPIAYEEMSNPQDPAAVVTFKYILDFKYTMADFLMTSINDKPAQTSGFAVSQRDFPTFDITLSQNSNVSVSVVNLTGQSLIQVPSRNYASGTHQVTIETSKLTSGIYVVTFQAGAERISRKMIVK